MVKASFFIIILLGCLKQGRPSALEGDVFFHFTCADCSVNLQEECCRIKLQWFVPDYTVLLISGLYCIWSPPFKLKKWSLALSTLTFPCQVFHVSCANLFCLVCSQTNSIMAEKTIKIYGRFITFHIVSLTNLTIFPYMYHAKIFFMPGTNLTNSRTSLL